MTIWFDNPQKLSFNLKFAGPVIAKYIFAYRPGFTQLRVSGVTEVFQRTRALGNVFGSMHTHLANAVRCSVRYAHGECCPPTSKTPPVSVVDS